MKTTGFCHACGTSTVSRSSVYGCKVMYHNGSCFKQIWTLLAPPRGSNYSPLCSNPLELLEYLGCEWGPFSSDPSVLILVSKDQEDLPNYFSVRPDLSDKNSHYNLNFKSNVVGEANELGFRSALFATNQRSLNEVQVDACVGDSMFSQKIPTNSDPENIFFVTLNMEWSDCARREIRFVSTGAHFVTPLTAVAILGGVIANDGQKILTPEALLSAVLMKKRARPANPFQ